MSSPSEPFECRWQVSRGLLTGYLLAQALAWLALWHLDLPSWGQAAGLLLCLAHAAYVLPRAVLPDHAQAFRALRQDREGWQVWSGQGGWRPVQIMADSMALPLMVVLRFRLLHGERPGWRTHSVCIACDALAPDIHRRLRVRLRFARRG